MLAYKAAQNSPKSCLLEPLEPHPATTILPETCYETSKSFKTRSKSYENKTVVYKPLKTQTMPWFFKNIRFFG